MEKSKLLIADSNQEFSAALETVLRDDFCIRIADNGKDALTLLESFAPEVLVLDVMLSGLDGIRVLECAAERGHNFKSLVTTSVRSDYIFAKLTQLKVGYVLMKPCDLQITAERIREIAQEYETAPLLNEEQKLAAILLELGMNPKHNGYHYLSTAVQLYGQDNTQSLTKELYVAVGAIYGVQWQQVERSIRVALEAAWLHRDEKVWRKWFPAGTVTALKRPSNGQVICGLAESLRMEMGRKFG